MSLDPIKPEAALELYLEDKQREAAEATVRSHRSRLGHFIDWCDEEGIDNMNDWCETELHFRLLRQIVTKRMSGIFHNLC